MSAGFYRGYINYFLGILSYKLYNKNRRSSFIISLIYIIFCFAYLFIFRFKTNNEYYVTISIFVSIMFIMLSVFYKYNEKFAKISSFFANISLHLYFWHAPFLYGLSVCQYIFKFSFGLINMIVFLLLNILWAMVFQKYLYSKITNLTKK